MFNKTILVFFIATISVVSFWFIQSHNNAGEKKPLYWVAPMDANYRRDAPGLSPMGMDLIPVYAEDEANTTIDSGVVHISSEVQNQLGVRTVRVEVGRLKQLLRSQGRVVFDQTLVSKISPRVSGWIDMLFVTGDGESVKRGQPLYSLYSPQLILAQEKYLLALNKGNKQQILNSETDLRALKFDDIAIARLKNEVVPQQSVIFHAQKDGMVGMLNIREDYFVEPGYAMLAIASLESVWIELDVFESQASLITPQQLLTFTTPSYPGRVWEGEVEYIYHGLKNPSQTLRFRAKIDNPGMRLKPNMHIQALITLPDRQEVTLVPRQSIIHLGQYDRVVLSLGDGRFKSVNVVLGESDYERVEVLEGLQVGDVVVSSAQFLIDSESSKTSDFNRMLSLDSVTEASKYPKTWVNATLKEINWSERQLRLQHDPIDAWGMPSMTMNFQVVDGVDMQGLELGEQVLVEVANGEPLFQILNIEKITVEAKQ